MTVHGSSRGSQCGASVRHDDVRYGERQSARGHERNRAMREGVSREVMSVDFETGDADEQITLSHPIRTVRDTRHDHIGRVGCHLTEYVSESRVLHPLRPPHKRRYLTTVLIRLLSRPQPVKLPLPANPVESLDAPRKSPR